MGGYLGTTPNAPRVVFCTPNTQAGPSGTNWGENIRIAGERVYAIGASVAVGIGGFACISPKKIFTFFSDTVGV